MFRDFSQELLLGRLGGGIKVGPSDPDLVDVGTQHRHRCGTGHLLSPEPLSVTTTRQGDFARHADVAHPVRDAVASNEPSVACKIHDVNRSGANLTGLATSNSEDMTVVSANSQPGQLPEHGVRSALRRSQSISLGHAIALPALCPLTDSVLDPDRTGDGNRVAVGVTLTLAPELSGLDRCRPEPLRVERKAIDGLEEDDQVRCRHAVGAIVIGGAAVAYVLLARPRQLRWGAANQEFDESLPGHDLVANANLTATRAISIGTSADAVWPWIAQLGQGRAGFYSYDVLENLVGCDIHSADRIMPEWQEIKVGHEVKLAPEVGLAVAEVDRGRSPVLRGGVPMGRAAPPYDFTWTFVLRDAPHETTRLLVRERYAYIRPWARFLVEPVEAVSFVMTQKMLRGIKDRAERMAVQRGEP